MPPRVRSIERRGTHHHVSLVEDGGGVALSLDGRLQLHSADERRYHAALVLPLLAALRCDPRVLVIGGGDGCAARDVLARHRAARVTVVDHEPEVLALAASDPALVRLNAGALRDPRVAVVAGDGAAYLRATPAGSWDAVILDLLDPDHPGLDGGFLAPLLRAARTALAADGGFATHVGSPFRSAGWRAAVAACAHEASGLETLGYLCEVPSFGPWAFFAAAARPPSLGTLDPPGLRFRC